MLTEESQPASLAVFGERTPNTPSRATTVFTPLLPLSSHSLTLILTKALRSSAEAAPLRKPGSEHIHCGRSSLLGAGCGNKSRNHHHKPAEEPQTPCMQTVSGHVRKSCYC